MLLLEVCGGLLFFFQKFLEPQSLQVFCKDVDPCLAKGRRVGARLVCSLMVAVARDWRWRDGSSWRLKPVFSVVEGASLLQLEEGKRGFSSVVFWGS
jgi:hypothetical protein